MSQTPSVESSIIIPVYNQWKFTETCLTTLAATLAGKAVEVIVIDNASRDGTQTHCPALGQQLFGDAFRYHRCERNLNFGPGSNLGARMACGEYLIFLNNDTELLPGWYEPLLADFAAYPDIAATGPVLLYPATEPFGPTVQHLGVYVSPTFTVGHLYEGIPAASPLAAQRRFFQIITAACMVMRRSVFLDVGMFDEHFINGFEDVDICARLSDKGYRMTVNPASRIIHHSSQTAGRYDHDAENARYLAAHAQALLAPDWHILCHKDGMELRLTPWLLLKPFLPSALCQRLDRLTAKTSFTKLCSVLVEHPYWESGWLALLNKAENPALRTALHLSLHKLHTSPEHALAMYTDACQAQDMCTAETALNNFTSFCKPWEAYLFQAKTKRTWCTHIGLDAMTAQFTDWLNRAETSRTTHYEPFMHHVWHLVRHWPLSPQAQWAYTLWRYHKDMPRRKALPPATAPDGPAFSILLPLSHPKHEHLAAALDSVRAQDCPRWELCLAVDASPDPALRPLLENACQGDDRIRLAWCQENSPATATTTALAMARHPWLFLMDQDDRLTPDALSRMADAIIGHPDALLFYADEDRTDDAGHVFSPHLKTRAWDPELLFCQDYMSHLAVYRRERLQTTGTMARADQSAAQYAMLLRYLAGKETTNGIIHIPLVLCHRRKDDGSLAHETQQFCQASQAALAAQFPGASMSYDPERGCPRLHFPVPTPCPHVTLLLDICDTSSPVHLDDTLHAWASKTRYPAWNVVLLYDAATASLAQRALLKRLAATQTGFVPHSVPREMPAAERLSRAVAMAKGDILGIVDPALRPLTHGWLEELVAALCRVSVGAVGGKLLTLKKTTLHGGYAVDASGKLQPLLCGLPSTAAGPFSWNLLARTVDALDGLCLFTQRSAWHALNGFDPTMGEAAPLDYCLRLGQKGLRSIWWPWVACTVPQAVTPSEPLANAAFQVRWNGRLPPLHPDLHAYGTGWVLDVDTLAAP